MPNQNGGLKWSIFVIDRCAENGLRYVRKRCPIKTTILIGPLANAGKGGYTNMNMKSLSQSVIVMFVTFILGGYVNNANAAMTKCDEWYTDAASCSGAQSVWPDVDLSDHALTTSTTYYHINYRDASNNIVYDCVKYIRPTLCQSGYELYQGAFSNVCKTESGAQMHLTEDACVLSSTPTCGAGKYLVGNSCVNVGYGYYSPNGDNDRYDCDSIPNNSYYTSQTSSSSSCLWACDAGYYKNASSCRSCTNVSYSNTCSVSNGSGTQTCYRTDGPAGATSSSACTGNNCGECCATSCNTGYHVENCVCVANAPASCGAGEYPSGGSCAGCNNGPNHSEYTGSGTTATNCPWQCDAGYYKSGSSCLSCSNATFTEGCSVANGTGVLTCYYSGGPAGATSSSQCSGSTNCGSCCATSCGTGYTVQNCACVPSSATSCGTGQYLNGATCSNCTNKPSNSSYTGPGTTATNCPWQCNSGYVQSGNGCNPSCTTLTCSSDSTCRAAGYQACSSSGCCYGIYACDTRTCSTDADCTSNGFGPCDSSTGCCTVSSTDMCSTTACNWSNFSQLCANKANNGHLTSYCYNGYCYGNVTTQPYVKGPSSRSDCIATCPSPWDCDTTDSVNYYCVPDCRSDGDWFDQNICGCRTCDSLNNNVYTDVTLTTLAHARGSVAEPLMYPRMPTSCYIEAGTYYDDKGTFTWGSDCEYTQ